MEIKNLKDVRFELIVECMLEAFKDYFVKMPSDVEFWRKRYQAARVDYELCFGAFDKGKLAAIIINGIDVHQGKKTAFNTGTGVIETYRGQKLVDQLYAHAFPFFRENGIQKCLLEVIEQNHRAIRVYERIGFQKDRFLRCFKGELIPPGKPSIYHGRTLNEIKEIIVPYQDHYSWDHSLNAIESAGDAYKLYEIQDANQSSIGYFVLNSSSIVQIEAFKNEHWNDVFSTLGQLSTELRINNVDDTHLHCLEALTASGFDNHINQFEMQLAI